MSYFTIPVYVLATAILIQCTVPQDQQDHGGDRSIIWDHNQQQQQEQVSLRQPTCTNIPANLSLCRDIGYSRMRLPNLLGHETLSEVLQQSRYWVPLLNLACSEDTQLFLCSLFTPICLQHSIQPCRSLCQRVRDNCTAQMALYGYPWPEMLSCDKYPPDNDLCIQAQSDKKPSEKIHQVSENGGAIIIQESPSDVCLACNQPQTVENILENFCRADVVFKAEVRRIMPKKLRLSTGSRLKILRQSVTGDFERRRLRRPSIRWIQAEHKQQQGRRWRRQQEGVVSTQSGCCEWLKAGDGTQYLVMARVHAGRLLIPTFLAPWKLPQEVKHIRKMLRNFDCSDIAAKSPQTPHSPDLTSRNNRKRRPQRKRKQQYMRNGRKRAGKRQRTGQRRDRQREIKTNTN